MVPPNMGVGRRGECSKTALLYSAVPGGRRSRKAGELLVVGVSRVKKTATVIKWTGSSRDVFYTDAETR